MGAVTPEDRFMGYVQTIPWCGCWIWTGGRNFRIGGSKAPLHSPHRAAYLLFVGDPDDLVATRECGVDGCVNPDHHYLLDVSSAHAQRIARTNARLSPDERRRNAIKAGSTSIGKLTEAELKAKMQAMRQAYDARRAPCSSP